MHVVGLSEEAGARLANRYSLAAAEGAVWNNNGLNNVFCFLYFVNENVIVSKESG